MCWRGDAKAWVAVAAHPISSLPHTALRHSSSPSSEFGWDMEGAHTVTHPLFHSHPRWGPAKEGLETRLWLSCFHSNRVVVFENPLQSSTLLTLDCGPGSEPRGGLLRGVQPSSFLTTPGRSAREGGARSCSGASLATRSPPETPPATLPQRSQSTPNLPWVRRGLYKSCCLQETLCDSRAGRRLQRGPWRTWPPTCEPVLVPEAG